MFPLALHRAGLEPPHIAGLSRSGAALADTDTATLSATVGSLFLFLCRDRCNRPCSRPRVHQSCSICRPSINSDGSPPYAVAGVHVSKSCRHRVRKESRSSHVISLSVLLFPATIETYSWRDTNFNQYFFEGYSFESSTWSLSSRVDGNVWGQNSWFNFSVSSIYSSLTLLLLMLPAIAFLWFVCRSPTERREIVIMVAAGLTYFLVVSLTCIWLNYTSSAPGNWTVSLFPALLIIGVMVLVIEYGYRWMTMKRSVRIRVSEDESLSEHVCDLARSQSSCKVLA